MAIPNASTDTQVTSTMTGQRGRFTIHEHAHEKMMGVLTNLYEDPEGAVIREYLTNALDAQKEAQEKDPTYVWRPVDVSTPSHFNKTYKIRDYGVGMSVEDIENIYSQYGYSTKEHTNGQTGMLGLGSKCGLTYTGQFTVIGHKNGVKTTALITLNEDEIPEYVILDTVASSEPSGVEISIPVKDRNTFAEKTAQFLRWWKDGEVLVNGVEPAKHNFKEVKPGVFLIPATRGGYRYEVPQSFIIMGNVPYAVDSEYVDSSLREAQLGFAAYVPMQAVDFPPNRERLRYNSRTKKVVAKISEGLFEAILKEKLKEISDSPDFRTAWQKKAELSHHFARHPDALALKYNDLHFPDRVALNHMELDWDWQGRGQISERQWLNVAAAMGGLLIVTGVDQSRKPTSYFKKKIKHYAEVNGLATNDRAVLVDGDLDNRWFDWAPRIDAETIKAIKLPKDNVATGPRAEATYEYYTVDSNGSTTFDTNVSVPVPAGKTLVYISPQDMKETYRRSGTSPEALLKNLGSDYVLVVMGKNRFDKFLRTHKAITAAKAIQQVVDNFVKKANDVEYLIGLLSYGEKEFVTKVDYTSIKDPELSILAKTIQDKSFTENYAKAEALHQFAFRIGVTTNLPQKKVSGENPARRYPLIDRNGGRQLKHMVIYVNAVWAAEYAPKQ